MARENLLVRNDHVDLLDRYDAAVRTHLADSLSLPLVGFADAYDGAPQEPKVIESTQDTTAPQSGTERPSPPTKHVSEKQNFVQGE